MAYQLFEKGNFSSGASPVPSVTVTKDAIFLNKAARDKYNLDAHEHVEFLTDAESRAVGIKLLDGPTLNSMKVKGGDGSRCVSAQKLIKFLGIAPGRYPVSYDEDENMIEFEYAVAAEGGEQGGEEAGDGDEEAVGQTAPRRRGRPRKAA